MNHILHLNGEIGLETAMEMEKPFLRRKICSWGGAAVGHATLNVKTELIKYFCQSFQFITKVSS